MMRAATRVGVLACVLVACATTAFAQSETQIAPGTPVVMTTSAPVYLRPDTTRVPLRTLAAGTAATAEQVQDGWVRITFSDPQYGPRTGWVERRAIKVTDTAPSSAPTRRGQPPDAGPATRPTAPPGQPRPRPVARPAASARVFGSAAFDRMLATNSFDAITGSDTIPSFGGGVQAVDVWRRLFVEFAAEYSRRTGERAFVFNDEVFRLGIPVTIKQLPVDLVAGWRFPLGRVTPFAGGGATFLRYEEQSDFAEEDDNVREWKTGFVALAGVETRIIDAMHVRVDFRYRRVEGALGDGGVSAAFNETALGGMGASVKVVFGR